MISLGLLLIILVYFFYPEKVITYPPGLTEADPTKQTELVALYQLRFACCNNITGVLN